MSFVSKTEKRKLVCLKAFVKVVEKQLKKMFKLQINVIKDRLVIYFWRRRLNLNLIPDRKLSHPQI